MCLSGSCHVAFTKRFQRIYGQELVLGSKSQTPNKSAGFQKNSNRQPPRVCFSTAERLGYPGGLNVVCAPTSSGGAGVGAPTSSGSSGRGRRSRVRRADESLRGPAVQSLGSRAATPSPPQPDRSLPREHPTGEQIPRVQPLPRRESLPRWVQCADSIRPTVSAQDVVVKSTGQGSSVLACDRAGPPGRARAQRALRYLVVTTHHRELEPSPL